LYAPTFIATSHQGKSEGCASIDQAVRMYVCITTRQVLYTLSAYIHAYIHT